MDDAGWGVVRSKLLVEKKEYHITYPIKSAKAIRGALEISGVLPSTDMEKSDGSYHDNTADATNRLFASLPRPHARSYPSYTHFTLKPKAAHAMKAKKRTEELTNALGWTELSRRRPRRNPW